MSLWSEIYESQSDDWDCGLACCQMVVNWAAQETRTKTKGAAQSSSSPSSSSSLSASSLSSSSEVTRFDAGSFASFPLWTIDLFILLHDSGVHVTFRLHTVCAGLGPHHYEMGWYENNLEDDSKRVLALFERAQEDGWDVQERSTSTQEVIQEVARGGVCIVLLDARSLRDRHSPSHTQGDQNRSSPGSAEDGAHAYSGHYVLLVCYDQRMRSFIYLDPASNSHFHARDGAENACSISVDAFERAWHVPGTDRDIIFCSCT